MRAPRPQEAHSGNAWQKLFFPSPLPAARASDAGRCSRLGRREGPGDVGTAWGGPRRWGLELRKGTATAPAPGSLGLSGLITDSGFPGCRGWDFTTFGGLIGRSPQTLGVFSPAGAVPGWPFVPLSAGPRVSEKSSLTTPGKAQSQSSTKPWGCLVRIPPLPTRVPSHCCPVAHFPSFAPVAASRWPPGLCSLRMCAQAPAL